MSQVWLIKGRSRSLGRTVARAVQAEGHKPGATARNAARLADLAERNGDRVRAVALDVSDARAAGDAIEAAVGAFGRLDVKPAAVIIQIASLDEPPLRPLGSAGSWLALLTNPIKRSIAWIWSTRRTRRAARELMALDDRMLADIGLTRGQVVYAVRHGRE